MRARTTYFILLFPSERIPQLSKGTKTNQQCLASCQTSSGDSQGYMIRYGRPQFLPQVPWNSGIAENASPVRIHVAIMRGWIGADTVIERESTPISNTRSLFFEGRCKMNCDESSLTNIYHLGCLEDPAFSMPAFYQYAILPGGHAPSMLDTIADYCNIQSSIGSSYICLGRCIAVVIQLLLVRRDGRRCERLVAI